MNSQHTQHILDELQEIEQFSNEVGFAKLQGKIHKLKKQRTNRRRLLLSTSITSAAAVVMLLLWFQFSTINVYNKSNVTLTHLLPDGSTVEMNKFAKLNYRRGFNAERELKLSGEAFFNIVPNATHPFVIRAGKSKVKVLGTSFNVRHDISTNKVEVLVKTGTVLLSNDDNYALELSASQFGIATTHLRELEQKDLNYMAWKNHKLVFSNSELPYVIKTIENTYHININLSDKDLAQLCITTTFDQLNLEEIMTSLCLTLDLKQEKSINGYKLCHK